MPIEKKDSIDMSRSLTKAVMLAQREEWYSAGLEVTTLIQLLQKHKIIGDVKLQVFRKPDDPVTLSYTK